MIKICEKNSAKKAAYVFNDTAFRTVIFYSNHNVMCKVLSLDLYCAYTNSLLHISICEYKHFDYNAIRKSFEEMQTLCLYLGYCGMFTCAVLITIGMASYD